ncbi:MAG: hypothetical protein HY318_14780 [Armatimonadetes bacterium]|nr:hypothetical protein [Armatimonadota bacterium]
MRLILITCLSVLLQTLRFAPAVADTVTLTNPGFEQVNAEGVPSKWEGANSHTQGGTTSDAPHSGKVAARIAGNGQAQAWRQVLPEPDTRIFTASGWFRARGVKIDPRAENEEYARFYFHIHYVGRPYSDATQVWKDLPVGTYDWTRLSVRLVPQTQWKIEKVWMTVAARFSAGALDFDDLGFSPAPSRGGFTAMEWANGLNPVVLSDMGQCTPASALAPHARRGHWRLIDYEGGGWKGRMVWASEETAAPPLTLPLQARGWHAIYLGLADPSYLGCKALVKLTRDPAYVPRSVTSGPIEEVFFKVAEVSGQSLHFSQQFTGMTTGCGLGYVKLVPLTDAEVAALKEERASFERKRLTTTIDGFSYIYERRPTTKKSLLQEVEVYRDSDFKTIILQMSGADMVNYPSKVGEMRGQDLSDFGRKGDRFYAESLRELARKKINPTKVLIDGAHDLGMKVHVSIRTGAWVYPGPLADFFSSKFFQQHPEWRCVDRDGTEVTRMSLAVPEVRAHLVEVLREAVRFGADGANVLFVRGAPYVLFEKPFCDLFRKQFGDDPLTLEETDPRILQLRTDLVTSFMQEIRTMLDEEGARRRGSERLQLSALVLANEADNLKFGIDVRRWVNDGLLDLVMPYLHAGGGTAADYDLKYFKEVCAPKQVPVSPTFIGWDTPSLDDMMKRVVKYYDAGADGITFWDGNSGADQTDRWSVVSRLGHLDELRQRADEGAPHPANLRFHKLDGLVTDGRYGVEWGY